jgi:hypothetical protein
LVYLVDMVSRSGKGATGGRSGAGWRMVDQRIVASG